jgi:hypothetical protein
MAIRDRCLYFHYYKNRIVYVGVGLYKRPFFIKWGKSKYYKNFINKYGIENIVPKVMYYELTEDEAYDLEMDYILFFGRKGIDKGGILLNRSEGGKTSASGSRPPRTKEWGENISKGNKGKVKHTAKGKKSISEKNSKAVYKCDLLGNIIKEYSSQWEAHLDTKINHKGINNVLIGLAKTAGGFVWKYK